MAESTRQKPRLFPGMFLASFASCSSRTLSDVVVEKSVLFPPRNSFQRLPSMCRPVSPLEPARMSGPISMPKAPDEAAPVFTIGDVLRGRVCPTAATVSRLDHQFHDGKKNKWEPPPPEYRWFSSDDEREEDDEEETDTLFSSRSFSSDSSGSRRQRRCARRRRKNRSEVRVLPMDSDDENNMEGSFAVVKKSSDPYGDFRSSMVEMIVEKQLFGAEDLERLFQCFLSLNSHHHHKVIVEVFNEVLEALFPHWS